MSIFYFSGCFATLEGMGRRGLSCAVDLLRSYVGTIVDSGTTGLYYIHGYLDLPLQRRWRVKRDVNSNLVGGIAYGSFCTLRFRSE